MYVIKARNKKYLLVDEDDSTITFNLVASPKAATQFASKEEAQAKAEQVVSNAQKELEYLTGSLQPHEAVALEIESLETQFLSLSVTEIK